MARFHPLASITLASFAIASVLPYLLFGLRPSIVAQIALLALSSPFGVLLWGHIYASKDSGHDGALVVCNVPIWYGWIFAVTLMWYFKPGLVGAVVYGSLLSVAAVALLWLSGLFRDPVQP